MKRLFLLAGVLCALSASAQFPNTDSLHRYNNRYIRNSAVEAFSNLRLNTLIHGIIQFIDSVEAGPGGGGIDTIYAVNDSLVRYRENGVAKTYQLKGVYDSRRKVDTAFALNDSILRLKINGTNRDVVMLGRTVKKITDTTLLVGRDTIKVGGTGGRTDSLDALSLRRTVKVFSKVPVGKTLTELRAVSNSDIDAGSIYRIAGTVKEYRYDSTDVSSPDDGVMTLVTTGGKRLKRITQGVVYAEDWATKDNFSDDDAPGLNAMFRFVKAQGNNVFKVDFGDGRYMINSSINLPDSNAYLLTKNHTYLTIEGHGASILTSASNVAVFSRMPTTSTHSTVEDYFVPSYSFLIRGIDFFGDNTNTATNQRAISIGGTYNSRIENCHFFFFDTAIVARFWLNGEISNNFFQGNRKVNVFGGSGNGVWPAGTICGDATNSLRIVKNRFNNASGSFAAIMLENANGANIEDNISEGNHPKYHVWLSGKESNCQTVNTIRKLWIESGGGSTLKSTVIYAENRNILKVYDLDIHGGDFYIMDARNADLQSKTHSYEFDGIRSSGIDTAFLIGSLASSSSFSIKNIIPGKAVYDYFWLPSTWGGFIPYALSIEGYDLGGEEKIYGSSLGTKIATGQRNGVNSAGIITMQGRVYADQDNLYQNGGFYGSLDRRPNAIYSGTFGMAVDTLGRYRFGIPSQINSFTVSLARTDTSTISVMDGITDGFKDFKARRGVFTRGTGYDSILSINELALEDFPTVRMLQEGLANNSSQPVYLDTFSMQGQNLFNDPIGVDTSVIATKEYALGLKRIDSVTRTPGVDSVYYWANGVLKSVIKDSIGPGSGGNDDWGAQTAVTDGTTTKGNGTVSQPIRADTTKMATKSYVDNRPALTPPDGTETKISNGVGYTVSGTGSTTNPYNFTITGTPSSNPFKALTIENYGGVANGSIPLSGAGPFASGTNNTPALQNMLDAAADGQMCIVPSGNWVFNTALDTIKGPTRKYLWILGNTYHNGADFWIVTNGSGAYEQHYFRHDGIAFGRFNFGAHTKNAGTGARQTPLWYQFTGSLIKVYNTNQQVFYLNKVEGFKNAVEFIAKGPFNGSQECTVYARWFNENANGITLTSLNGDSYNDKHKFYVDRIGGGLGIKIDGYSGVVGTDPWNGAFRSLQFYALVERVDSIMDAFGDITEPLFQLNVEGGTAFGVFGEYGFNMLSNTSNYVRNPVYRATGVYDYSWVISMGINGRIEVPIWNAGYKYADEAIIMNDGTINCISNSPPAKHVQDAAPARFLFTRAGGPTKDVAVTGTSYTVQFADRYITATNAAGVTINMPAANVNVGRDVTVRNIHNSSVVTFSGASYITTLPDSQAVTLHSNGVIWYPTTNLSGGGTITGGGSGSGSGYQPWIKTADSINTRTGVKVALSTTTLSGILTIGAGSASLPSLVILPGSMPTVPVNGEFGTNDGVDWYATLNNTRRKFMFEPVSADAYQIYRRNAANTGSEYVDVPYRLLYSNTSAVTVSATSPLTIQSGLGTVVPNYGPNGSKYKFTAEGFVSTTSGSQTLSVYVQPPGMGQIISTFSVPGGLAGDAFSFDFTMTQQGAGYGYTARLKITDASSGSNLFERAVTTSTSSGFNPGQTTPINVSMAWGAGSNSISTRWATWELFRLQ